MWRRHPARSVRSRRVAGGPGHRPGVEPAREPRDLQAALKMSARSPKTGRS